MSLVAITVASGHSSNRTPRRQHRLGDRETPDQRDLLGCVTSHEHDPVFLTTMIHPSETDLDYGIDSFIALPRLSGGVWRGSLTAVLAAPVARPVDDDLVSIVGEAVERALREDRVVEEGDPLLDGAVGGHDGRGSLVPFDDDFVEIGECAYISVVWQTEWQEGFPRAQEEITLVQLPAAACGKPGRQAAEMHLRQQERPPYSLLEALFTGGLPPATAGGETR
ncbi:hypothetical protein BH23GEM3_BH23GEM3_06690 [soil metagenome]